MNKKRIKNECGLCELEFGHFFCKTCPWYLLLELDKRLKKLEKKK